MPEAETDYEWESIGQETRGESLARVERRNRVIRLRRMGLTYEQISETLGKDESNPMTVTSQQAYRLVTTYLERMATEDRESVEQLRELENLRLDSMQKSLEVKVQQGNVPAIKAALGVMERRTRLNGLDRPELKVFIGAFAHVTDVADPATVEKIADGFQAAFSNHGIEAPAIEGTAEPVNGEAD